MNTSLADVCVDGHSTSADHPGSIDTMGEDVELGNVASMEAFKRPLAIRDRGHPSSGAANLGGDADDCGPMHYEGHNGGTSNERSFAAADDDDDDDRYSYGEMPSKKAKRMFVTLSVYVCMCVFVKDLT